MAHSCCRLFLDLQGPFLPGAHVTGPVMRSTAPAGAMHAGKGLCPPSVPADTPAAKLVNRIGQNLPKTLPNHTDIPSRLLGSTVAAAAPDFHTWL